MVFFSVVLTLWLLVRTAAPSVVRRDADILLVVLIAQAGVGYSQYFTGVPVVLVGIHIFGAVCVWVAALRFAIGLRRVVPPETGLPAAPATSPERVLTST